MSTLTLDDVRALARSSPWLWRTLRFSLEFERPAPHEPQRLRAWVSRPHGVRVEDGDGRPIQADWQPPADQGMTELTGDPVFRSDGLVARRPRIEAVDEPMPRELFGPDLGGGRSSAAAVSSRS